MHVRSQPIQAFKNSDYIKPERAQTIQKPNFLTDRNKTKKKTIKVTMSTNYSDNKRLRVYYKTPAVR